MATQPDHLIFAPQLAPRPPPRQPPSHRPAPRRRRASGHPTPTAAAQNGGRSTGEGAPLPPPPAPAAQPAPTPPAIVLPPPPHFAAEGGSTPFGLRPLGAGGAERTQPPSLHAPAAVGGCPATAGPLRRRGRLDPPEAGGRPAQHAPRIPGSHAAASAPHFGPRLCPTRFTAERVALTASGQSAVRGAGHEERGDPKNTPPDQIRRARVRVPLADYEAHPAAHGTRTPTRPAADAPDKM